MIKFVDGCVGCETCYGNCDYSTPYPVLHCDKCDNEVDEVYMSDDGFICFDCLVDSLKPLTVDDFI